MGVAYTSRWTVSGLVVVMTCNPDLQNGTHLLIRTHSHSGQIHVCLMYILHGNYKNSRSQYHKVLLPSAVVLITYAYLCSRSEESSRRFEVKLNN